MSDIREAIATNIRRCMKRRNMTTRELVAAAKVSNSQFFDVLKGDKSTTVDWLSRVAGPLKVPVWKLVRPAVGARAKRK
jgi:predicted transcriptional regulator